MPKEIKFFKPQIRSRHNTHKVLKEVKSFPLFPFKSVIRLGSYTKYEDSVSNGGNRIELNTVHSITNSADKLFMKKCFDEKKVKTALWTIRPTEVAIQLYPNLLTHFWNKIEEFGFPIIAKHRLGSKGKGNYKLDSKEDLNSWIEKRLDRIEEYIFEKFYNFAREYRLHVTKDNYFYTCRKMLKNDTPEKDKWYRNDEHCVWIMEDNELFDKPVNWNDIVENSINALKATGLDFGAVDVKVQSAKDKKGNIRKEPEFIIIEINSAPSFGEVTAIKYLEILPHLLLEKSKEICQN